MYNYVEKLRDPSHVKALIYHLQKMFKEIGLTIINTDSYGVEMELERLLQSSFPNPGGKDKIHRLFIEDVQNVSVDYLNFSTCKLRTVPNTVIV
jgi:hypothetical protein